MSDRPELLSRFHQQWLSDFMERDKNILSLSVFFRIVQPSYLRRSSQLPGNYQALFGLQKENDCRGRTVSARGASSPPLAEDTLSSQPCAAGAIT